MAWPSLADYNSAFAIPARGLIPASLKAATLKLGPLGVPLPISGGLAYIYDLTLPGGKRKAVRCFIEERDERMRSAAESCGLLSSTLETTPSLRPYFAKAEWFESCVAAGGRSVPALVMDWVEGRVLCAWLEASNRDGAALRDLRGELAVLARNLEKHGIVHGDLQARNIFVADKGLPILIDYDELRFIGRSTSPAFEGGHPHFQHPAWSSSSDYAKKDRFPLIALDLGLAALAAEPGLFDRFATGENILFVRDDYIDPDASPAFAALHALAGFSRAAELFAGLCRAGVDILPSLEEFKAEAWDAPSSSTAGFARAGEAPSAELAPARPASFGYVGPYPVFEGRDFAGIQGAVGKRIEVVGRIVSVKDDGITKHGAPYVFVNFADWRGNGFKLTIWEEGLDSLPVAPDHSWEGRWVSATGLVDEPYVSQRWTNTQLSITIQDSSQLRFIDEAEARRRAGKASLGSSLAPPSRTSSSGTSRPSNAELLAGLAASKPAQQSVAIRTGGSVPSQRPAPPRPPSPSPERKSGSAIAKLLVGAVVAFILYVLFNQ